MTEQKHLRRKRSAHIPDPDDGSGPLKAAIRFGVEGGGANEKAIEDGFSSKGYPKVRRRTPYTPPVLPRQVKLPDGGDPGPRSIARGEQEVAYVPVATWNAEDKVEFKEMTVARRRKPGVITQLSLAGSEALNRYVDAYERIGGASATEFDVSVDGGKVGDGGVLHRTQLAAELRRCEALISGYRVQHPSGRSSNTRAEIEALHVLKMVGAGWIKPKQILRDHRWGINKQNLFRVNQTFGWTILRLKIAFGIEDFKRVFDSPPGFLVQYRTTEIPDER